MKKTALNEVHKDLGAKMVDYAGFEMPVQYAGVTQEHMAVREGVGVFDVSHMGQFRVSGENAETFLQKITTNDVSKVKIGQAQYSCMTNEHGGIIDDLIIYKMDNSDYMLVVNAGCLDKDWEWINKQNTEGAFIENQSENTALLAIQGPDAIKSMQALTDVNLSEIKFYNFVVGNFAGIEDVVISATGYTGSGGFEIYFAREDAAQMWEKVFEAGKEYNIVPCGLASRDTLRLEKGYCLYGNDIDETTTPLESGLGWITKLNKDFIGKEELVKQKEEGLKRKLVAFKMIDKGVPRKDYAIVDNQGNQIGQVTSGTQSPILKEGIGMGYVTIENAEPGREIFIQVRNKNLKAEVVKTPFL
ncbi:MAG: glycine cleavage system aminomethyltransferase GcvT [Flavobacteriaceae bacterium]|nr:glycine cleavage system aminomethyltransferase GcvT [Flavobacteriaceae bacterium]